jgi:rod shape-determining protein MreD
MGSDQRRRLEEQIARELALAVLLMLLAAVQITMLPRIFGAQPNLILVISVIHALLNGVGSASRWAFYAGIGLDLCSGTFVGTHTLALLTALLVGTLPLRRVHRGNWLVPLASLPLGAAAYYIVLGGLTYLMVAPLPLREYAEVVMLPGLIVALVPALPLYIALRWIHIRRRGEVKIDVY